MTSDLIQSKRSLSFVSLTGQREKPITIKLEPLANAAQQQQTQQGPSPESSPNLSDGNSTKPSDKSPLQRQFSVVKRNAITLAALPQTLSQGKANVTKSRKQSHSSRSSEASQSKKSEQGEKKRRFSGGGRLKKKREGKGKYVDSEGLGGQENSSWSPENKRRAPDIGQLNGKSNGVKKNKGDVVDGTLSVNVSTEGSVESSLNLHLVSDEEQEEGEKIKLKPFALKKHDEQRSPTDTESPPVNLFFSFKEELLKRATESRAKSLNDDDKVAEEGGIECVSPEFSNEGHKTKHDDSELEKCDSLENESESYDSRLKEENLAKHDNQRKFSDCSVQSDSTKSTRSVSSQKTTVSDEIEPSAVPKSVQRLREKFLNINDMIDEKHKSNLAKKSVEIQRELRCISAWKQQTEAHVSTSRKHSVNSPGKTGEVKKPNIGTNRRSVKELRKMYMANGSNESKAVKGKSDLVQSRSGTSSTSMERKSSLTSGESKEKYNSSKHDIEDGSVPRGDDSTSQSKDDENSSESRDFEGSSVLDTSSDGNKCLDATDNIVIINVDHFQVDDNVSNDNQFDGKPLSSEEKSRSSHVTKNNYKVIKSDHVSNEVPSLQIEPARPDSSNSERHSPGLKRHSASHDSGIDMPLYTQSNFLGSVPVDDGKITARNLKVAAEFSFPGSGTSVSPTGKQLPSESSKDLQSLGDPLSPGTGYSPEILWSLPLSSVNRASLSDSSSSCSSPRMSVVIAQESSTTKINSRFFTVETMEPWDLEDYRIAEEHQCVMEVEGEFCFGRENSKTSRAEREAIFSLRDGKNHGCNGTDLIKEEEITLSPAEIDAELQSLEALHRELERRGVEIEHSLRESMDCKYAIIIIFQQG